MRLAGKLAIVTGGGLGIGAAIAKTFAREGADVVIYDYNPEAAQAVVDKIKAGGGKALAVKCDISRINELVEATNQVVKTFKKIDILVNDAGVGDPMPLEGVTEPYWDKIINTNLKGTFFCSQVVGKQMIKQGAGNIINMASTQSLVAAPLQGVYAASKGGILALTRSLAVEWAKYHIRVNAVSPSLVLTERIARIGRDKPGYYEDRWKRVPSKRLNQPQDVANVVLFLASDESDNIYGQNIIVDGGAMALHSSYVFPEEQTKS